MKQNSGSWLKALGCLAIVSLFSACGGGGANIDPPVVQSTQVTLNPASLNFGSITVGGHLSENLTLSNSGTASVTISGANVNGHSFSIGGLALPLTITAGQSANFSASFAPTAAGSASGTLSVVSNASNSPTTVSLSGTGASLQIAVNPASLNLGEVTVGSSGAQTVTLKNTGTSSVTVSKASVSGAEFAMNGLSLPANLPPGQTANFGVTFAPKATGFVAGSISLVSDASNSPATVSLSGTGVAPQLAVNPSSINFGNVALGGNSSQTLTLINSGTTGVTISQASVLGSGFALGRLSLPMNLGAGQSAGLNVTFSPQTAGNAAGTISVISNASNSPLAIPLSGQGGTVQLSVSPASISFGNVKVGANGSQTVTLTNTGTSSVTVTQGTATGAGFSVSGLSVPLTLAAGQSLSFNVTFAPTQAGNATGSVSVLSNASNSPTILPLAGTGITLQISANPTSLNLGNVTVGSKSTAAVMLTNTGTANVTISQASVSGTGFSMSGLSLPTTLSAGQNTSFNATFSPTTAGRAAGNISVISTASNSPLAIPLSGAAVTLALTASPASVSFGNVTVGNNSSQVITLKNAGTGSVTVTQATVSGTGFNISGLALPLNLAAGQSANFNAVFGPAAAGISTGSISVVSTAPNSPLAISLLGTGVTMLLNSSPASLSFGNVTVGQNNTLPVVLTNTSSASIQISQASVIGAGFSISGLSLPQTLGAGQNTGFNVTFTPTAAGNASGSVSVVSNATNSPVAEPLSGTGVNAHTVSLSWSASTSQNVTGYNVYRSTVANGPYTQINSSLVTGTAYTDTTVQAGQTYYYVTTAVNSQQVQSPYSTQAQATVSFP